MVCCDISTREGSWGDGLPNVPSLGSKGKSKRFETTKRSRNEQLDECNLRSESQNRQTSKVKNQKTSQKREKNRGRIALVVWTWTS